MVSEHILIIEDEAAIQSILAELLMDAGYAVTTASDGLEGISKFREGQYSLVLLDIMICPMQPSPLNCMLSIPGMMVSKPRLPPARSLAKPHMGQLG